MCIVVFYNLNSLNDIVRDSESGYVKIGGEYRDSV
jgi:hypothetical protein